MNYCPVETIFESCLECLVSQIMNASKMYLNKCKCTLKGLLNIHVTGTRIQSYCWLSLWASVCTINSH